ncbi:TIGR04197 family type VII secretion effector [Carnobacterium gallinarum]|uniref:TIGR04197 family type VII secretion effector n=1 Tax=Carnobacterium gallinarum TaxID=2749 RepID=UPI00054F8F1D|nr:TIGR04197 family type VII secretion effector [Carnobacterium gallinarum]
MTEISSNKATVLNHTNSLVEKKDILRETTSIVSFSSQTNLTAQKDMIDAFGDALQYIDNYCSYLEKDIENILKTANLFEETDEFIEHRFEELQ